MSVFYAAAVCCRRTDFRSRRLWQNRSETRIGLEGGEFRSFAFAFQPLEGKVRILQKRIIDGNAVRGRHHFRLGCNRALGILQAVLRDAKSAPRAAIFRIAVRDAPTPSQPVKKSKSPVAYARGSERTCYGAATVRESVPSLIFSRLLPVDATFRTASVSDR
jgi:hypothetical protein